MLGLTSGAVTCILIFTGLAIIPTIIMIGMLVADKKNDT